MNKLVTVCDLTLSYGGHRVLEGLSFEIHQGDYLCILGENGSGKTTLVGALLGLLPARGGSILYHGMGAADIGYLPQQTPLQKDFPASVSEVVLSGCLGKKGMAPRYTKQERQKAQDVMERLHILPLERRAISELSGGQRQRVLLARALCAAERLLVLDEPAASLDAPAAAECYETLDGLHQSGMALVVVTHDNQAARRSSHILHLGSNGHWFGATADYEKTGPGGGCDV